MINISLPYSKIILGTVSVIATAAIGFLLPKTLMQTLIHNFAYYFVFTIVMTSSIFFIRTYGQYFLGHIQHNLSAILLATALTSSIFVFSPPFFKIFSDETNLIGTSLMMHEDRITAIPVEGFFSSYLSSDFATTDIKRPMLFAFLTSILHNILGYSPNNGFVLNFVVSIFALLFFYLSIIRLLPKLYGFIGMLLLASAPIYVICATSSGFELLNMLFLVIVFFFMADIIKYGFERHKIELLLFSLVLFAYCRYESIVVLPIVFIFLIIRLWRTDFLVKMSWIITLLPLSLLPALWVRMIHWGKPTVNVLEHKGIKGAHIIFHPFKLKNLINNLDDNLFIFTGLNTDYGFTLPIFLLSGFGTYLLIRKIIIKKQSNLEAHLLYTSLSIFIILLLIITSFGWGNFGFLVTNRLSLVFLPFLCWGAVYGIYKIHSLFYQKAQMNLNPVFIILAVFHLLYFWPEGADQRIIKKGWETYEYGLVSGFLKKKYPNHENTLIITFYPNHYLIQGYSALRINNLQKINDLINKNTIYDHILVIQKINKINGTVRDDYRLEGNNIFLKEIAFFSLSSDIGARVSELQGKRDSNWNTH